MSELVPANPGEFLIYRTEDGQTRIEVRIEGETVWLSQKVMAELFQKDVRTVNEHIRNIFHEGELQEASVIRNFRITATDGKQYDTQHYNLDVILAVGYRDRPGQTLFIDARKKESAELEKAIRANLKELGYVQ